MNRYLLESERLVFAVRRHSAVLAGTVSIYVLLVFVAAVLLAFANGSSVIATTGLVVLLAASAWFAWKVGDWWVERFTVTDRRVLLVSGLLTRRVAIMPLRKVTDLTFERSVTGRLLGYGAFVMESAGQQQALSRIDFLPRPESLYLQMSDLLFGTGEADHDPDEDAGERPSRTGRPARSRATARPRPPETHRQPAPSHAPRVTSRPPPPPPSVPRPAAPARQPPQARVPAPPLVPRPPGATTPLPTIAGGRPLARRPRGRQQDPAATDPTGPGPDRNDPGRHQSGH